MSPKTLFALLSAVSLAKGQYEFGNIASCLDFGASAACNQSCDVQGRYYPATGMLPFETPLEQNFTWTVGMVTVKPFTTLNYDPGRFINLSNIAVKDYYLGTPPGLDLQMGDLNGYHGCAAFFVDSNATFPFEQAPGTCDDVIGDGCASAIRDRAVSTINDADGSINSADDLCSSLQKAFEMSSTPEECSPMALDGRDWGRLRFRPITGSKAPALPTQSQNQSTDCHPVIPSSYNLRFALNFNASQAMDDSLWNMTYRGFPFPSEPADFNIDRWIEQQAVPILSVFAPTADTAGDVVASVSCLDSQVDAFGLQGPDSGAGRLCGGMSAAWMMAVVVTAALLMI